jgi:hypothetical protein
VQVSTWKKELQEPMSAIFERKDSYDSWAWAACPSGCRGRQQGRMQVAATDWTDRTKHRARGSGPHRVRMEARRKNLRYGWRHSTLSRQQTESQKNGRSTLAGRGLLMEGVPQGPFWRTSGRGRLRSNARVSLQCLHLILWRVLRSHQACRPFRGTGDGLGAGSAQVPIEAGV